MEIEEKSTEEKILDALQERGASLSWLARQTSYSYTHFYNVFKQPGQFKKKLTKQMLNKVNEVLKTDFKL